MTKKKLMNYNKKNNTIYLNDKELESVVISSFGLQENKNVSLEKELSIENDQIVIRYYLVFGLEYEGEIKKNKKLLSYDNILCALNDYVQYYNYEITDMRYVAGIYGGEETQSIAYSDGIEVGVKEREKLFKLIPSKNRN